MIEGAWFPGRGVLVEVMVGIAVKVGIGLFVGVAV
jgi:hypothetical protein